MIMTIDQILKESPVIADWEGKQWAFYSTGCCWWTSYAEDLGNTKNFMTTKKFEFYSVGKKGKQTRHESDFFGLPCCPHCGALLMQAPLVDFIEYAKRDPAHYGTFGMATFVVSHERNIHKCFRRFMDYEIFIKPFGKDGV